MWHEHSRRLLQRVEGLRRLAMASWRLRKRASATMDYQRSSHAIRSALLEFEVSEPQFAMFRWDARRSLNGLADIIQHSFQVIARHVPLGMRTPLGHAPPDNAVSSG